MLDVLKRCSFKLYWPLFFLNLRPNAGMCAPLRLFAPELAAIFCGSKSSQIVNMFAICDVDKDPGYMPE